MVLDKMISKNPLFELSQGFVRPFGTNFFDDGINFSIFSKHATSVTLCLFLKGFEFPVAEILLNNELNKTGDVWHIFVHNLSKDHLYAYRIDGPAENLGKNRFDPKKFLLDPFAKAVYSEKKQFSLINNESIEIKRDTFFLGAVSVDHDFDWENVKKPKLAMKDLIIYEMHVRGFTIDQSSVVKNKGTFLGIIEKIPHLIELGINAVELMPVQEFNENEYHGIKPLNNTKLCDYWGYSTLNFFSLNTLYAKGKENNSALIEFKTLVRELHRNNIEVIVDVVFNHTSEGNYLGPTISFRGIDNSIYYILDLKNEYYNFSGCGNTFNCNHPVVTELILEALRYFAIETHIDGFRFDLASILNRDKFGEPKRNESIVELISQDPILSKIKLIAEPWDAAGFYQVGSFYPDEIRWSEWNGRYRDTIRLFISGIKKNQGKFASRISGSEDLYHNRAPFSSINFITSHDGFSLADLVSYNHKHNLANGEENKDGLNYNISWNCGVEGDTLDEEVLTLRQKQMRNFHMALMISQGVPMIYMGDEYGHTKNGNNNTWCQDNTLNWFQWDSLTTNSHFYRFYRKMINFRKKHSVLRKSSFLTNQDIFWHGVFPLNPSFESNHSFIAFTLIDTETDENLYVAFNAENRELSVQLPLPRHNYSWHMIVNTANSSPSDFIDDKDLAVFESEWFQMVAYSSVLFKEKRIR